MTPRPGTTDGSETQTKRTYSCREQTMTPRPGTTDGSETQTTRT